MPIVPAPSKTKSVEDRIQNGDILAVQTPLDQGERTASVDKMPDKEREKHKKQKRACYWQKHKGRSKPNYNGNVKIVQEKS